MNVGIDQPGNYEVILGFDHRQPSGAAVRRDGEDAPILDQDVSSSGLGGRDNASAAKDARAARNCCHDACDPKPVAAADQSGRGLIGQARIKPWMTMVIDAGCPGRHDHCNQKTGAPAMDRSKMFWSALAAAIMLSAQAQAQQTKNVRFVLDWAFQGQQGVFTLPASDGTFARYHLNVTVDRGVGSGDTVSKVASGAYDVGQADLYSMVRFMGENPAHPLIAVFMVNDKSALAIETMAKSAVIKPQDLAGKSIAAPAGDASRQLFPLFASVNHIDQSSIKWLNVSPELREPMLVRGEAEAVSGNVPTVLINLQAINIAPDAVRVMAYASYGVGLYGLALVTRPEYAEANPDVMRDLIRGTVHGLNRMIKDPAAAVASVRARDPLIDDKIELDRIKMTLDYAIITPNVLEHGYSNVDPARLASTLAQVAPAFNMNKIPTPAQVYSDKYLPPRDELKVAR
jgi:NitT/TauT family transport system substrate-binding protein